MKTASAGDATMSSDLFAPSASLDASDDFSPLQRASYCPRELLDSFTLLMAGHGRCVSADMMLGDREYSMWQLARAHTLGDDSLRVIAARLFDYFDDPCGWGARLKS